MAPASSRRRLAGYLFNREAGLDVQYIPFNGSPPTVQGLLDAAPSTTSSMAPPPACRSSSSGKLRALAKLNSRPLPALPEVDRSPSKPAFQRSTTFRPGSDLVAPAGTPRGIVDKIRREIVNMYADPVTADRLEKSGISTASSTPEEFEAFVRKELVPVGTGIQG